MLRCSIIPLSRLQGCLMLNDEQLCAPNNAKHAGLEALSLHRALLMRGLARHAG